PDIRIQFASSAATKAKSSFSRALVATPPSAHRPPPLRLRPAWSRPQEADRVCLAAAREEQSSPHVRRIREEVLLLHGRSRPPEEGSDRLAPVATSGDAV